MRTSSRTSRHVAPPTRGRRREPVPVGRRVGKVRLVAGLVTVLCLWLSGCGDGGAPALPTPSRTRTTPSATDGATEASTPPRTPPTRPPRTSATAQPAESSAEAVPAPTSAVPASTRPAPVDPPTSDPAVPSPPTSPTPGVAAPPPTATPTPSAAGAPTSDESSGLQPLGWILLAGLATALVAALAIRRSRGKTAWDTDARALETETRTLTGTHLPPVLTAQTPGQRALSWPPVRAGLVDLTRRWELLADRASDDPRRNRSLQIRSLLQDLVAAMDAENDALATGRDWRLLRHRVDEVGQALSATLAGVPAQGAQGAQGAQPAPGERPPPAAG